MQPVRPELRGLRSTVVAQVSEDADSDALAITAVPSDAAQATVSVAGDSSKLTLADLIKLSADFVASAR